jgi:TatD DNase family protein
MPMQLIDTHVHINFDVFQADLSSLQDRWREAGVVHLVHSCVEPKEFAQIQSIADRFPEMSFAIGLHPLEILTAAQSDRRVVAIGEMGLDFYKADNHDWQVEVFRAQLEIAYQLNKPVIIHCRDAAPELREVLQSYQKENKVIRGVMHCWSGMREETQWFLDLGFYISFSGIVTFKKAETVQDSAKIVPLDRLLVETDCPFLAPVPYRGKRNEPAYVRHVAEYLAQLRGISLDDLAQATTHNACQLFSLPFQPE